MFPITKVTHQVATKLLSEADHLGADRKANHTNQNSAVFPIAYKKRLLRNDVGLLTAPHRY